MSEKKTAQAASRAMSLAMLGPTTSLLTTPIFSLLTLKSVADIPPSSLWRPL